MNARERAFWLACAVAFLVLGLVQFPEILTGATRWDERLSEYIPWRVEVARQWRAGEIPFFTDRIFGGMPLLALGYAGVLYPPNLLYAAAEPKDALEVANVLYVLHTMIGGLGMAAYLRARRLAPFVCFAGAMFFAAGTFGLCHAPHISMREGAMMAPWIAWAARRVLARATARRVVALAIAVAAEALIGYPQMLLFALCWAGIEMLGALSFSRAGARRIGGFAAGIALGLGIAAPQLATGAALVPWTTRGALDVETWQLHGFDPAFLPQWLMPRALSEPDKGWLGGEPWGELAIAVNAAAWAFAIAAVVFAVRGRNRTHRRAIVVAACGIVAATLLASGSHFAPNALLFDVPPFGLFRIPSRWLWLATTLACVLAAEGIALALRRDRGVIVVGGTLAGFVVVCLVAHVAFADESRLAEFLFARPAVALAHVACIAVPMAAIFAARRWPRVAACVLFAALAGEYRFLSARTVPEQVHPDRLVGAAPHPLLDGVAHQSIARIFPLRLNGSWYHADLLPQATNLFLGWPVLTGYAPTTHKDLGYWPRLSSDGGSWSANEIFESPSQPENFGVSHLMVDLATATTEQRASFDERVGADWNVVRRAGDLVFVELLHAPGRFQLAPSWIAQHDLSAIDADWWTRLPFREERPVLVQTPDPAGFPPAGERLGGGTVEALDAKGGSFLRLRVLSDGPGVLVVRDAWWPGWQCRTIGPGGISEWAEPARVQGMLRAMAVPAGESVAEMRYVPPGWRKGLPVTVAALMVVAALLFRTRRREAQA